jgi:cob(I)alamin adenosyltransferase
MKIYTKTGDGGDTGLLGGTRVPKDHRRVAAIGEVDELNALLGVVQSHARSTAGASELVALLGRIQRDLFALGAQLADPTARVASRKAKALVGPREVKRLERAIDAREQGLPPLTRFILPGGAPLGAFLHLSRTVCRRAERALVTLDRANPLDPRLLTYVNRLSDLLFVLARHANVAADVPEDRW